MTEEPLIDIDHASVSFDSLRAVDRFSMRLRPGERVALMGRTGAGKSTILSLLVGSMRPTSGSVRILGLDPYAQHAQLQGRVAMAFQTPRLLPWRTSLGNVAVGLEILRRPKAERRRIAEEWLGRVHLQDALHKYPSQLSGGMRQRVSLARAFAVKPELIFLDESFSALDEVTARSLRADFVELCESTGTSAVIVTHSIEEAFAVANRVIVLGRPARVLCEYDAAPVRAGGQTELDAVSTEIRARLAEETTVPAG
ncbi:NitT/TauT family transport system ATP-binding protein [Micromonospora echinaurantiaca]|uniref:NitT/TauT family transport system ATP-binding protein n=1 Tax=Micromonospora echinaurantiaca TaxID=47857 RepID=A0A1C5I3G8_9ACTN|nr:ATP-binding cassette domain-containing protein [Micromonospora echinaurantiaca]SCG52850.1 NitT/TauT family transport system ATP-binding protein [Micromonospora echinaurantiaca]